MHVYLVRYRGDQIFFNFRIPRKVFQDLGDAMAWIRARSWDKESSFRCRKVRLARTWRLGRYEIVEIDYEPAMQSPGEQNPHIQPWNVS